MPKKPRARTSEPKKRRRQFFKEWRDHRGLTQEQLAERINKSRGLISQLESGYTDYTGDTLEAMAFALMCDPWDLLHVDPSKEGEVYDLMRHLDEAQRQEAETFIRYLSQRKSG